MKTQLQTVERPMVGRVYELKGVRRKIVVWRDHAAAYQLINSKTKGNEIMRTTRRDLERWISAAKEVTS